MTDKHREAYKKIRARLEKPWVKTYSGNKPNYTEPCERCGEVNPAEIHTCTPKQREWVGLTDEEEEHIVDAYWNDTPMFIEAIEAKLKEKNT
jgi:hypothetical protein